MTTNVTVRRLGPDDAAACVEALADVLVDCVEGGASISFMSPFGQDKAIAYWHRVFASVGRGECVLLVAEDDGRIVGTVQLQTGMPENQPHRADVAKMLVHRSARRRGIGQRLMAAVDEAARAAGRTVLVLDTQTGSDAERLYERAGWQKVGVIPNYALLPGGDLCATTYFYRQL